MSDNDRQELNTEAVPFFARYLEDQDYQEELSEEESQHIGGGRRPLIQTKKAPSDNEEVCGGGFVTTMKYPSDNEEGGGGSVVTLKFPSDNEEGGGGVIKHKHPSNKKDLQK
ncbi:microviridin/marinostatin family tricyclic proteinase inhibitor [Myxosarcina sp. GI1]|uniref:microviridin/marinostatin family tricyclic proteinase inhibitor n=1 Tax=Myxosarcina sp. GI1 TaxID=1541065 RepID=UPI000569DB25|nr:microviridin/marinostatin family tricyclic proteinase inhibitor [Myxosarcina sp. GI1]